MQANILCKLLAKRILPEQFQLHGLEIHWMDGAFNTPENRAIIDDVLANYDTLEAEQQADLDADIAAKEAILAAKAQAYIDNLPSWSQVKTNINNITNLAGAKAFLTKLARVVYWGVKNTEL
jgi:hypothetical protein